MSEPEHHEGAVHVIEIPKREVPEHLEALNTAPYCTEIASEGLAALVPPFGTGRVPVIDDADAETGSGFVELYGVNVPPDDKYPGVVCSAVLPAKTGEEINNSIARTFFMII